MAGSPRRSVVLKGQQSLPITRYPSPSLERGDRAKLERHFKEAERELGRDADSERGGIMVSKSRHRLFD